MKLVELQLKGYKSFQDFTIIPIKNISVLIGENDAGKSSIIRAIELLLTKQIPASDEYFTLNQINYDEFEIGAKFEISTRDNINDLKNYFVDNILSITKRYKKQESFKTFVKTYILSESKLEHYKTLNVEETKALLKKLGIGQFSNQEVRKKAIKEYIHQNWHLLQKELSEVEINFSEIERLLPSFQYYGSHIYGNPQLLIKKTLDNIYTSHFYDEAGNLKLVSLKKMQEKIFRDLNNNIKKNLLSKIKFYNNTVKKFQARLEVDFSKGLDFQGLEFDDGTGFKLIEQKGEGSKKRLFLSILEWDKDVQFSLSKSKFIIRAYDEPDINLHYDAQRKIFNAIKDVSNNINSNIQSIIATHSVAMIDKANSNSIIHVSQKMGISTIDYLRSDGDNDIANYLNQISIVSGIKNSSIFYERCFLLVEGASEESAIPIIYKKMFNRTISESGIVLINLNSNGAWYNFLKLLNKNKSTSTVLLLDSDTQNPDCKAKVTVEKLTEIGFSSTFMKSNVFFAGIQEFEDIFPDSLIRDVFNLLYTRPTKGKWNIAHIRKLRAQYPKISMGFSDASKIYIKHHKRNYNKPEFATELANLATIKDLKKITVLEMLFEKVHSIID